MKVNVQHYEAFSAKAGKGNPAGFVLNGEDYSEQQMQQIAYEVGFNETSFIVGSSAADFRIRYFTPGHEMNLCGHATVASLYALRTKGLLHEQSCRIETRAGILPIRLEQSSSGDLMIVMQQAEPQFVPFDGSVWKLASSIGISVDEMHMKPDNALFPGILEQMPRASVHPFCMEVFHPDSDMHARHFSSPYSGTVEDPVTGTASGVMAAYYAKFLQPEGKEWRLRIEQGQEIGRDGSVETRVMRHGDRYDVEIAGTAVYADELTVEIEG